MRIGLGLGPRMEMRPVQKLSAEQRAELRHEQAVRLGDSAGDLRRDTPFSPDAMYDNMVAQLAGRIRGEQLRTVVDRFLRLPGVKNSIFKHRFDIAKNSPGAAREIITGSYYPVGGHFSLQAGSTSLVTEYVAEAVYRDAMQEPGRLREELTVLEDEIRRGSRVNMERRREMQRALEIADDLRGHAEQFGELLEQVIMRLPGDNGVFLLQQFAQDTLILERLAPALAQRTLDRFASRFMQITKKEKPENLREAFLNIVGEYILVSLGILTSSLFELRQGEVETDELELARDRLKDEGVDLNRVMNHWGLKQNGVFFWNRWAVVGFRQDQFTDEMVRGFITEIVRQEAERILATAHFDRLFAEAKSVAIKAGGKVEERQAAYDQMREILVAALKQSSVQSLLRELMSGPWFERLVEFMRR